MSEQTHNWSDIVSGYFLDVIFVTETIYIDGCCKLMNKILSIFGPNATVKRDLFHTV